MEQIGEVEDIKCIYILGIEKFIGECALPNGNLGWSQNTIFKTQTYPSADDCLEECKHWNRGGKVACQYDIIKRLCKVIDVGNVNSGKGSKNVICWSLTGTFQDVHCGINGAS